MENRFPKIWVPSGENRDLRQLLWHRHRMVQARTRIMNQLQAVALNEGLRCKKKLWREKGRQQLEAFRLAPWASRRREDLLQLVDGFNPTIRELMQAIEQEEEKCPEARRLRTHPGVGALTALAFVLIIGRAERFQCGKQIAAYLGLVPLEDSSGNRRRLGHITKQGSSILRFLLVEAAQVTARSIPEWRNKYVHLTMRRGRKIAKLAMARRLAIALYRMWVDNAGIVIVRDAMFRQRSAIDLVRTYALPANSRFSVDTFTFSPSLIKRGTRISRPVSSRAVLVPPPDDSPRTAGSVSATSSSTNIGSSKPIGLPLYLRSSINAP